MRSEGVPCVRFAVELIVKKYLIARYRGPLRETPDHCGCCSGSGHLSGDALMIFDDILRYEGMQRAWKHLADHTHVRLAVDLDVVGMCIVSKEANLSERYALPSVRWSLEHPPEKPLADNPSRIRVVRKGRFELPRPFGHRLLRPARLPVPPLPRAGLTIRGHLLGCQWAAGSSGAAGEDSDGRPGLYWKRRDAQLLP